MDIVGRRRDRRTLLNCWHGHKRKGKEDIPGMLMRGRACVVVAIYKRT